MRSIYVRFLSAIVLFLSLSGCDAMLEQVFSSGPENKAKMRVQMALTGAVKGASNDAVQKGIMAWTGLGRATLNNMDQHYDDFGTWQQSKGLWRKIERFEILDSEPYEDDDAVKVTVKINRKKYKIKVPKNGQMSWAR